MMTRGILCISVSPCSCYNLACWERRVPWRITPHLNQARCAVLRGAEPVSALRAPPVSPTALDGEIRDIQQRRSDATVGTSG
jgi:hypothetical protein